MWILLKSPMKWESKKTHLFLIMAKSSAIELARKSCGKYLAHSLSRVTKRSKQAYTDSFANRKTTTKLNTK